MRYAPNKATVRMAMMKCMKEDPISQAINEPNDRIAPNMKSPAPIAVKSVFVVKAYAVRASTRTAVKMAERITVFTATYTFIALVTYAIDSVKISNTM